MLAKRIIGRQALSAGQAVAVAHVACQDWPQRRTRQGARHAFQPRPPGPDEEPEW